MKREPVKFLFVVPGIAWVALFTLFPLLYSLRLAFMKARLTGPQKFIWFSNFAQAFGDYRFWAVLVTTVYFVVFDVAVSVLVGLILAYIFSRPLRKALGGSRFFRSLFTMPMFTAPIALGYLGLTIFHEDVGAVNTVLKALGMINAPRWFSDVWLARFAISIVDIWQWTPFCFLVLLAGLQSLPEEVYEAAVLDTSSGWQMFRKITLPMLGPVLFTVIILRVVETFKLLDIPFALTSGGPGMATQTYSFFIYLTGLRNFNSGYASALAYILLVIMLIISSFFFRRLRANYD
ncbi:MAG TPA: sugar ABC transporter permease [Spirochaetia bacterium]|nr:sugar ABC transporter permease [Spirochaetia bacterium]